MRLNIFLLYFLLFFGLQNIKINAQKLYIQLGYGNGFGVEQKNIGANYGLFKSYKVYNYIFGPDLHLVKGSLGQGSNFGLVIGYNASKLISFGLELSYLHSSAFGWDSTWHVSYMGHGGFGPIRDGNDWQGASWHANVLRLIPFVKVNFKISSFTPFVKLGMVFRLGGRMTENFSAYYQDYAPEPDFLNTEFYGGNSLGIKGEIGCENQFTRVVAFVIGINYVHQNWSPKYSTQTADYSDHLFNVNFIDNTTPYLNPDLKQTSIAPTFKNPFSSLGFNLGFKFTLHEEKRETK